MDNIYFYKPDDKPKYTNDCELWVIARLVDIMDDKKNIRKWMEPLWFSVNNDNGIVVYLSRLDAEISVQHMKLRGEHWTVYPLDHFNITEMMRDNKQTTKNNKYHFIYSFGYWVSYDGELITKEIVLSQSIMAQTFNVDRRYETTEHIVIRFSEEMFNYIYSCWNDKISGYSLYKDYLKEINKIDGVTLEQEAKIALDNIAIIDTDESHYLPGIAAIWSMKEKKWVFSNLNNSIN